MAAPKRPAPRLMHVCRKQWVTPHMIRVTCTADWMADLPAGIEGAHFKLFLPEAGQGADAFALQLAEGPRPIVRTYTIRFVRPEAAEIDIDFVDHGDTGPASAWARACAPGDFAGFSGPGPVKLTEFHADTYVVAADMSALPVAAATLEAMPRDAKGVAFFEITSAADRQNVNAPEGIDLNWLVHPDPSEPLTQSVEAITALPHLQGRVQTCIAGESGMIRALRAELINRRGVPKAEAYISGYWKIGLIEDQHQQEKRAEAAG